MAEAYDCLVAGSGAGGSAVAARLCEGGARVLLVETGGEARPAADAMTAVARYYTHGGFAAAAGNCLLPIPTGTVLGGTTQINGGTCLMPRPETLRSWETGGSFRAEGFQDYLGKAWEALKVGTAPRETASASSRLFLKGLETLGVPGGHLLDRAESGCRGSGRCCFVCPERAKMSADKAFLDAVRERPGFELRTGTSLESFETARPGRALRARLKGPGGRLETVSARRLVLACGSLRTPYFLRRFLSGPAARRAGDGLSVHPAAKVFGCFDEPVRGWTGVPQGAGLLDPSEPRLRYEGVYTPPELAAITLPLEGRDLRWWLDRYDRVATFGYMVRDLGRGSVRYPLGPSFPAMRYDLHDQDLALMLRGMRFIGRVLFAAGARRVVLPLNTDANSFGSAEELAAADFSRVPAARLQMMAFHPLGTCAMGRVVDEDLRAAEGVYVCDGSVVPESLGVNPQITIYAFALRLADHLLERSGAR